MSVADVFALLRGSTDEHKFAGLALLPRVCVSAANVDYRGVYEAISLEFIWRLLVPLRDPRFIATVENADIVQKQLLGASIALSVLSLLSRDESVAKDPTLWELIPCLARLTRARTLAEACGKSDLPDHPGSASAEVHKDALELLWNLCNNAEDAATIALESNVIASACEWLHNHFLDHPASSSQCALFLIFTVLQPYLPLDEHGSGNVASGKAQDVNNPRLVAELQIAVEGIVSMCAVDCSPSTEVPDPVSVASCLERVNLNSRPAPEELKSLQLQGFSILAAIVPCLSFILKPEQHMFVKLAWAENLRIAVHRALRSRLPLCNLLHVISVLDSLVELEGMSGLLFTTSDPSDTINRGSVASLLSVAVQVLKIQVFSHLQGCVLHARASRSNSVLPDNLQLSQAVFTVTLRLFSKVLDLVVAIDQADDCSCGSCLSCRLPQSAVVTAHSEGILEEVLKAMQEIASLKLDFILFTTRGCGDDWPEPEQIPARFQTNLSDNATGPGSHCGVETNEHHQPGSAELTSSIHTVSAFKAQFLQGSSLGEPLWEHWTVKSCCQSVGMLLSLTGGAENCKKLLDVLPDLCTWVCRQEADSEREQLAPVELLMSALYSIHTLKVSGDSVAKMCKETLQQPEVFVLVSLCGTKMMQHFQQTGVEQGSVWTWVLSSQVVVSCELISSAIRTFSKGQARAVERTYLHIWQHGDSSAGVFSQIFVASRDLQNALGAEFPSYIGTAKSVEDVFAIVDAAAAVAEVACTAMSEHSDVKECDFFEPLCNALGTVRLVLFYVLKAVFGECAHLVRDLECAATHESTCWQCSQSSALLARVEYGLDVLPLIERCCGICDSIFSIIQQMPLIASLLCDATCIGQWFRNDVDFEILLKTLEETASTVSLGHSLRMLARVMRPE